MKTRKHPIPCAVVQLALVTLLLFAWLTSYLIIPALALTPSGSITNISATASNTKGDNYGSVSLSGNTITMMAKGYRQLLSGKSSTTTVTITAEADMTLSFTATVTSGNGSVGSTSGSNISLSKGSTYSFTVVSAASNNAETWATVTLDIKLSGSIATTFGSTENGTYTVTTSDNVTVFFGTATGGTDSRSGDVTYTVVASPATGYEFGYWVDADGVYINDGATYSFSPTGKTIRPVFYPKGSGRYYVLGTPTKYYGYLDLAIAAANSSGTVVVCKSGDVTHSTGATTITIPAGVTLLLPYSSTDTSIKSGTSQTNDFKHANVNFRSNVAVANTAALNPETGVTYALTIPEGITLNVANGTAATVGKCGRIVIGGSIVAYEGNASSVFEGVTYGAHSNLIVNGSLKLGNYAVLSIAGYVLGTGDISTTGSGAEIYQPLAIRDWRGAGAGALFIDSDLKKQVTIQSGETEISPYSQWGTFNIQAKLAVKSGNIMYLYATLLEGDFYCNHPVLVGNSTTAGLLQLYSGATLITAYEKIDWSASDNSYGFPGKTTICINGGASVGSMSMNIELKVLFSTYTLDIDTATMTLPVSYCYDFVLNNGDYYVDKAMALLPGVALTVNRGAVLHIGENSVTRFAIFDGLNNRVTQHNGATMEYKANTRANTKNYPTTTELQAAKIGEKSLSGDAELIINGGTLVIGEHALFGGLVQTTGTGKIDATAGTKDATISTSVQVGVIGTGNVNFSDRYVAGMSLHQLTAQVISAGTKESTNILRGYTYTATSYTGTQESYSFKYYPNSGNVNLVVLVGNATLTGDEKLVAADGSTTDGATAQPAHPLNETIYGAWCAGHDSSSGVCSNCKLFDFYASNVRLGNSLEMMFAFPAAGLQGDLEGYYVKAVRTYADGSHEVVTYYYGQPYMTVVLTSANGEVTTQTLKQNAWRTTSIDNVTYHVISYNRFAAKEMCDSISLTVCKTVEGAEKLFSVMWVDSIQDYTMRLLEEHMESKTILCRLLVDMLNYGAACQTHFGYDTGNLANAKLTAEQTACGTQNTPEYSDDFADGRAANNNGYWSSSTVIADTDSQFAVAFNNFTEGMYFTYSLTNHWDKEITKIVTFDEMTSPGVYHELANLRIADVRNAITITVYNASNEVLGTWSDSIEAYCTRMINGADNDAQEAVYIELLKFADSANAYLHSDEVLP